jgi:hypothetical protein
MEWIGLVETVRRYSKLPHLWSLSKRLARWLESSAPDAGPESISQLPYIHKLSQRLPEETVAALARDFQRGASLAELQRQHSLSRGSIQRLLREAGVRRRRKSLTEAGVRFDHPGDRGGAGATEDDGAGCIGTGWSDDEARGAACLPTRQITNPA